MDLFSKLADSISTSVQQLFEETPLKRPPSSFVSSRNARIDSKKKDDINLEWVLIETSERKPIVFPGSNECYDQTSMGEDPSCKEENERIFDKLADKQVIRIDLVTAVETGWNNGIPHHHRPLFWKLLLTYYTPWLHSNFRLTNLKKQFYTDNYLPEFELKKKSGRMNAVRRDLQSISYYFWYFQSVQLQEMLERVLYIVSVQSLCDHYPCGLSQLAMMPLFILLHEYHISGELCSPDDLESFDDATLTAIEHDLYWMVYYLFNKSPREPFEDISKFAKLVEEIIEKKDPQLLVHLTSHQIEFTTALHGWLVALLFPVFRKLPLMAQLWDRYIIASEEFWHFHACVCASLLLHYSSGLMAVQKSELLYDFFVELSITHWEQNDMAELIHFACSLAEDMGVWQKVLDSWKASMKRKPIQ